MNLSESQLRQHLLGQTELDAGTLTSPQAQLRLEIAESNLIDEYAMGTMSPADRQLFERNFLNSQDREERLALARGIAKMSARRRVRRWLFATSAAAAAIAFAVFVPSPAPPVYNLEPNSQRGASAQLEIRLKTAPEFLAFRLYVPEPPPPCVATVTRIGDPNPIAIIQIAKRNLPFVQLTLDKSTISLGDYSVSLQSGTTFQQDFVFRVRE